MKKGSQILLGLLLLCVVLLYFSNTENFFTNSDLPNDLFITFPPDVLLKLPNDKFLSMASNLSVDNYNKLGTVYGPFSGGNV